MADRWFYRMFGEELGPVTLGRLKELAHCGTLSDFDEVRSDESETWIYVSSVDWSALEGKIGAESADAETAAGASTGSRNENENPNDVGASSNDSWFCLLGDSEFGPWTFEELKLFAESGQLTANDEVKLGVAGKWRKVGTIGRLMALLPYDAQQVAIVGDDGNATTTVDNVPVVEEIETLEIKDDSGSMPSPPSEMSSGKGQRTSSGSSKAKKSSYDDDDDEDLPQIRKEDMQFLAKRAKGSVSKSSRPVAESGTRNVPTPKPKTPESPKRVVPPLSDEVSQETVEHRISAQPEEKLAPLRSPVSEFLAPKTLKKSDKSKPKKSTSDDSYELPSAGQRPRRASEPPEESEEELELLPKMVPVENDSESRATPEVAAVPTQAAFHVAYEQAKAKIAQAMLAQADAAFKASEEQAKTHVEWATAPNVDKFWYGWASGVEFGPVEFNQVFGLAKSGQLKPTDFVRNGQYAQFAPASNVPGLFTAVAMIQKAAETLSLAKSQALTVAALAGEAPPPPVDLSALAEPTIPMPAPPPPAPKVDKKSGPSIDTVSGGRPKSNPAVTTSQGRKSSSDADMSSSDGEGGEGKARARQNPPERAAGPNAAAARNRPANADQAAKNRASNPDQPARNPSRQTSADMPSRGAGGDGGGATVLMNRPNIPPAPPPKIPPKKGKKKGKNEPSRLMEMLEPLKEPKAMGAVAAVSMVVLMFIWQSLPPSRTQDRKFYTQMRTLLDEIKSKRSNPSEIAVLKQKLVALGKEVEVVLKKKASRKDPVKQSLLWAARDDIPAFTNNINVADSGQEKTFDEHLHQAAYGLGLEKRPPQAPVVVQGPVDQNGD